MSNKYSVSGNKKPPEAGICSGGAGTGRSPCPTMIQLSWDREPAPVPMSQSDWDGELAPVPYLRRSSKPAHANAANSIPGK